MSSVTGSLQLALLCFILLATFRPAQASLLERRLESSPAAGWMSPARKHLLMAAGTPTLAGPSMELGLRGELELQAGIALQLDTEVLEAASYREETLRTGLVLGRSIWVLRILWEGTRAGVEGLPSENRTRAYLSLATHSGPLSFGVRQIVPLDEVTPQVPDQLSWAMRLAIDRLALALLREDARWGGQARWSAGLEFRVAPALRLGLSTDEVQGQFLLQFRHESLALRVSIPVASLIDAGPYLGLEWSAREGESRP